MADHMNTPGFINRVHTSWQPPVLEKSRTADPPYQKERVNTSKDRYTLSIINMGAHPGNAYLRKVFTWLGFRSPNNELGYPSVPYHFQNLKIRNRIIRKLQGLGCKIKIRTIHPR